MTKIARQALAEARSSLPERHTPLTLTSQNRRRVGLKTELQRKRKGTR